MQPIDEEIKVLIQEGLAEARRYLPVLTAGLVEVAVLFQKGELAQGESKLAACLEGVCWLIDFVTKADYLTGIGKGANSDLEIGLREHLATIAAAIDNGDTVTVADILEYELLPMVDRCGKSLADMSNDIVEYGRILS